jgi:hypothetical protein
MLQMLRGTIREREGDRQRERGEEDLNKDQALQIDPSWRAGELHSDSVPRRGHRTEDCHEIRIALLSTSE